jgi:methionine sulfoxide reductase heme-binding subunit
MTVWYIARGAGLAALVLLSLSTAIGALMTGRGGAANRVVVQYLHRVTGSLGLAALALHLSTILADSYAHVGWAASIIPFTAAYRPTWVGLGTLAGYTLLLVAAVGFARGRMAASKLGARVWRGVHGLAYAAWGLALLHGLKSGSDTAVPWVRWLYLACGIAVIGSIAVRIGLERRPDLVRGSAPRPLAGASR